MAFDTARLDGVYITQKHEEGRVSLSVQVDVKRTGVKCTERFGREEKELEGLSWRIKVMDPKEFLFLKDSALKRRLLKIPVSGGPMATEASLYIR